MIIKVNETPNDTIKLDFKNMDVQTFNKTLQGMIIKQREMERSRIDIDNGISEIAKNIDDLHSGYAKTIADQFIGKAYEDKRPKCEGCFMIVSRWDEGQAIPMGIEFIPSSMAAGGGFTIHEIFVSASDIIRNQFGEFTPITNERYNQLKSEFIKKYIDTKTVP